MTNGVSKVAVLAAAGEESGQGTSCKINPPPGNGVDIAKTFRQR
jgi:hypothetical protein